jgi:large subunit ribosomal protein L25
MNESALTVYERTENLKSTRKSGFIPGVLYGGGFEKGVPVKFEESKFIKLVHNHSSNAKVWIEFNGKKHFGMIKDQQKDILNGKIIHVDIRMLSQADDVRIKIPILFNGMSELEHKNLKLKIQNNQIDISGHAGLLPEHVVLNVEELKPGETIQVENLKLDSNIKVHDPANEIYAIVMEMKNADEEGTPSV